VIVKLRRKNLRYPDLKPGQAYVVIGIEADDLRILNDAGRPFLYPRRLFTLVDSQEPSDWVTEYGEEGERYAAVVHLLLLRGYADRSRVRSGIGPAWADS